MPRGVNKVKSKELGLYVYCSKPALQRNQRVSASSALADGGHEAVAPDFHIFRAKSHADSNNLATALVHRVLQTCIHACKSSGEVAHYKLSLKDHIVSSARCGNGTRRLLNELGVPRPRRGTGQIMPKSKRSCFLVHYCGRASLLSLQEIAKPTRRAMRSIARS